MRTGYLVELRAYAEILIELWSIKPTFLTSSQITKVCDAIEDELGLNKKK